MKQFMKLSSIFLLLSLSCLATTLSGKVKNLGSSFNGKVVLTLNAAGAVDTSTNSLIAGIQTAIPIVNGQLQSGFAVPGNDVISPQGTVYIAQFFDNFGAKKMVNAFRVTGSSFDIGAAIPTPITTSNVSVQDLTGLRSLSSQSITTPNIDGFFYVDGVKYLTVQQAITAACAVGGGTVFIPPGTFAAPNLAGFTLCSNLNILGAGRGLADSGSCVTTITTNQITSDTFPITNMTDVHVADLCIKNLAVAGANAALRLNYGQRVVAERLFITGPWAVGIELDSSSTSLGSTIWNTFRDIHNNNLAPNGIGCLLNSSDAVNKVINNNTFDNVTCSGATTGVNAAGAKLTNTNFAQVINENVFKCGEAATNNAVGAGTGVLITQGATADTMFIGCNVENNLVGFSKATANTVTWIGGNIQSNGTNVSDAQPAYTSFLGTRIGGIVPNFGVTPIGGGYFDSYGIGGARPTSIAIDGFVGMNGVTGYCLSVSAICNWEVQTSALVAHTDNATDIGLTGAKRPRDIYLAGTLKQVNQLTTVGNGVSASYGQDDKTGQSGNIGSTALITGTATSGGHYSVCYQLATTTSDASGASITLTVGWTSDSVARTNVSSSVALASTANGTALCVPVNVDNSINITYLTTVTGAPAAGRYSAHVWAMKQ